MPGVVCLCGCVTQLCRCIHVYECMHVPLCLRVICTGTSDWARVQVVHACMY